MVCAILVLLVTTVSAVTVVLSQPQQTATSVHPTLRQLQEQRPKGDAEPSDGKESGEHPLISDKSGQLEGPDSKLANALVAEDAKNPNKPNDVSIAASTVNPKAPADHSPAEERPVDPSQTAIETSSTNDQAPKPEHKVMDTTEMPSHIATNPNKDGEQASVPDNQEAKLSPAKTLAPEELTVMFSVVVEPQKFSLEKKSVSFIAQNTTNTDMRFHPRAIALETASTEMDWIVNQDANSYFKPILSRETVPSSNYWFATSNGFKDVVLGLSLSDNSMLLVIAADSRLEQRESLLRPINEALRALHVEYGEVPGLLKSVTDNQAVIGKLVDLSPEMRIKKHSDRFQATDVFEYAESLKTAAKLWGDLLVKKQEFAVNLPPGPNPRYMADLQLLEFHVNSIKSLENKLSRCETMLRALNKNPKVELGVLKIDMKNALGEIKPSNLKLLADLEFRFPETREKAK